MAVSAVRRPGQTVGDQTVESVRKGWDQIERDSPLRCCVCAWAHLPDPLWSESPDPATIVEER